MKYEILKPITYKGTVLKEGIIELDKNEIRDTLVKRGILKETEERKPVNDMKKEELIELARKNKIKIDEKDTKDEIIAKIKEAEKNDKS